jgi:hypothetical protein
MNTKELAGAFKNDAAVLLLGVFSDFPGLIDGETEVDAAALIELLSVGYSGFCEDSKTFASNAMESNWE